MTSILKVDTIQDSPATTSSTTYQIECAAIPSGTICVNRSFTDTDNSNHA
jgi:hypothetical protein